MAWNQCEMDPRIDALMCCIDVVELSVERDTMAVFAREIIGRNVIDSHSVLLGTLQDITFDKQSGSLSSIRVKVEADIDPAALPWEMDDGLMRIPVEEIARIASRIHLKR